MTKTIEFMRMFLDDEHFDFTDEDVKLFNEALTNKGTNNVKSNYQRLTFLGDAILGAIIREHTYTKNPDWTKGELSRCRVVGYDLCPKNMLYGYGSYTVRSELGAYGGESSL